MSGCSTRVFRAAVMLLGLADSLSARTCRPSLAGESGVSAKSSHLTQHARPIAARCKPALQMMRAKPQQCMPGQSASKKAGSARTCRSRLAGESGVSAKSSHLTQHVRPIAARCKPALQMMRAKPQQCMPGQNEGKKKPATWTGSLSANRPQSSKSCQPPISFQRFTIPQNNSAVFSVS